MLGFYGLVWWKNPAYSEEITDFGWTTTTLPHADSGDAAVTSEDFTPALCTGVNFVSLVRIKMLLVDKNCQKLERT